MSKSLLSLFNDYADPTSPFFGEAFDVKGRGYTDSNFPPPIELIANTPAEVKIVEEFLNMAYNREFYIQDSEISPEEREDLEAAWEAEKAPLYFRTTEEDTGYSIEIKRTEKPYIAVFRIVNEVGAVTWGMVNS